MVKPDGLDTSALQARFPFKAVETFDPGYFKSIQGYNRLLLSTGFYERFLASAYLLICQLDVFVFRDDLAELGRAGLRLRGRAVGLRQRRQRAASTG